MLRQTKKDLSLYATCGKPNTQNMYKAFTLLSTLIACILCSGILHAQVAISGNLIDANEQAVEFAEILLMNLDSIPLSSGLADTDGKFSVKTEPGTYLVQIRQLAQIFFFEKVDASADVNLGTITIDNTMELDELTVTARMKLVKREVDRTVYDVENSTNRTRGDAIEVLSVTPSLRVQGDQLSMIGKSNLAVMIDDKIVRLQGEELTSFLRSIASEDIASIEVITTPPARYEAEGNSGMVNIKLKRSKADSWNASVKSSHLKRTYYEPSLGGNFNISKGRFSGYASLNWRKGKRSVKQDDWAYFEESLYYAKSDMEFGSNFASFRAGVDYKLSDQWTTGGQLTQNIGKITNDQTPYSPVYSTPGNELVEYTNTVSRRDRPANFRAVNFFNSLDLDTIGTAVTINLDYFRFHADDSIGYNGVHVYTNPRVDSYIVGKNLNVQNIQNYAASLDIELPSDWANLEFGAKVSHSISKNDIGNFNSGIIPEPLENIVVSTYDFKYTEDVEAIYLSGSKKLNAKLETQLGLRLEATQTDAYTSSQEQSVKNDYLQLFPTAFLSYQINERSAANISASRRIQRPQFGHLNPNLDFPNIYSAIGGNPLLQPSYISSIDLGYNYGGWDIKAYYSHQQDAFEQLAKADTETNFILFQFENYFNVDRLGLSQNYSFEPFKWWSSNNSFDVNYSRATSFYEGTEPETEAFTASVSSYNDFRLNPDRTLLASIGCWYNFPYLDGVYSFERMSALSAGLQALLLDKNLTVALNFYDLLRMQEMESTVVFNGVDQLGIYYWDHRAVQLSVSYSFGNQDLRVRRNRSGNQEELRRAN